MIDITTDTRLNLCKVHVGIRTHLNPMRWKFGLPHKPHKWWINPFFGPIELTLFAGKHAEWISLSTSIDFEWGRLRASGSIANLKSYRFHPFIWKRSFEDSNRFDTYWSSRWFGPIWIYTRKYLK
jgi:hypothetical protein